MSTQSDRPDISVVVPVYEEAENIGALYRALNTHLEQLDQSYEVILVDDGSKDGSWEQLRRWPWSTRTIRPFAYAGTLASRRRWQQALTTRAAR